MTTNTNSPAPAIPQPAGDREAGSPPGSASRTLRERVAEAMLVAWAMHGDEMAVADAAIAEVMAWQPIETAPKDGGFILAVVAPNTSQFMQHHAGRVFVIRHEGVLDGYNLGWSVYPGFGGATDANFTHWMPLPSPPNRGEK